MQSLRLSAALILLFICQPFSPLLSQSRSDAIDALMRSYAADRQFNGAVLVAERGKVIYSQGIGPANIEWNVPATSSTRFRLASISKQFTALVILQLAQEGRLDLDAPVVRYLPEYPRPQGEKITIHHLLTHSAGLPNQSPDAKDLRAGITPQALLARYWALPLDFEPGTSFSYSNSGYVALGLVIEALTGKSYEQAMSERVFDPLGMKCSGYENGTSLIPQRATGYVKLIDSYLTAPFQEMSQLYASGALYSTVEDLYLWDRALYSDQLLDRKHRDMMFRQMVVTNAGGGYGYGWVINKATIGPNNDSITIVSHSGGLSGFGALITRLVDQEHLIVLLDNRSPGAAPLERITRGIATILHDGEPAKPHRSIAASLLRTIRDEGIGAATREYRNAKSRGAKGEFNLAENELNMLGYELLREGSVSDAIEIFKLNVESYPNAPNTYDSLGEGYMIAGERDLALRNYRKALQLDPQNRNAAEMLKKLAAEK